MENVMDNIIHYIASMQYYCKAVVLATAATVLAVPLFSQSKSCIHSIRKLLVYLVRVHVNNGSWSIDALCGTTRFTCFSSSAIGICVY